MAVLGEVALLWEASLWESGWVSGPLVLVAMEMETVVRPAGLVGAVVELGRMEWPP